MATQAFPGTFSPPAIGATGVPISVAGKGTLTITPDGLAVSGFKAGGSGLVALGSALVVAAAALGGAYVVEVLIFKHHEMSSSGIGAAVGAGVIGGAAQTRRVSKDPLELVIPWSAIYKVSVDPQRKELQVVVKKHKPKGVLHFQADADGNQAACNAIQAAATANGAPLSLK